MDESGEAERQAEDERLDDDFIENSGSSAPRAARKCVQKKLSFYLPNCGDEREDEAENVKGKSLGKARSGRAEKAPITCKDTGPYSRSKRSLPPVVKGADFFLKVSEKKLKQKHQIGQNVQEELKVGGGVENYEIIDVQNKWWLNKGKKSTKQHRLKDLNDDNLIVDLSKNEKKDDNSTEGIRSIHPFFSQQKTKNVCEPSFSSKSNRSNFPEPEDNLLSSCPPIHVSDILQDEIGSLDWDRWEIHEYSFLHPSKECSFSFNSAASTGPLKLDNIIPSLKAFDDRLSGIHMQSDEDTSNILIDRQKSSRRRGLQDKNDQILASQSIVSLDNLQNDGLPTKSVTSNQEHHFINSHLWTNKHKPEKVAEVCGNVGAIKFLVEWLSSWQEKNMQTFTSKFICIDEDVNEIESNSEDRYVSDFDSENEDEHSLKNVLVVMGPVGCGKTAAIYASAKELKFNVIEVNASDVRNGAHIKQKFGEAMDSHGIELRSGVDTAYLNEKQSLSSKNSSTSQLALKKISKSCKSIKVRGGSYSSERPSSTCRVANKNLLLFEDVDAILHEDRGFFSTIMQLAETSKRPIILTTNSKALNLPCALDKQVVSFTRPSTEELLSCLLMVCSSEGAIVSPKLLEQLIITCQGDMRKTILLLQFWCQGVEVRSDRSLKLTYSPLEVDLDAAHWVIENILPWEMPCELTLKIEEEISKTVSCLGGNVETLRTVTEDVNAYSTISDQIFQSDQCLSPEEDGMGFSNDQNSPLIFLERGLIKRRPQVVVSSPEDNPTHTDLTSSSKLMEDEVSSCSHVCDTYNSFCPETEITIRDGFTSAEVNSQYSNRISGEKQDYNDNKTILITDEDTRMNFSNMDDTEGESGHGMGLSKATYQIMDECSCVGFNIGLKSVERPISHSIIDLVAQKWKSFRSCQEDFKLDSSVNHKDVIRIIDLTSSLTHLISDADILLGQCQLITLDVMEPSEIPHDEPCSSAWYDEHLKMSSIFSQHGLSLYASKAVTSSSNFCYESSFHLAHEMLAASTRSVALGKLLSHKYNTNFVHKQRKIQKKTSRESVLDICDAVRPMIPRRLQMMLHSQALYEYISSLSFISKAETSRLSGSPKHVRPLRRAQAPRHYLRSLPVALSPEKMEFYAGYGCFNSLDFR